MQASGLNDFLPLIQEIPNLPGPALFAASGLVPLGLRMYSYFSAQVAFLHEQPRLYISLSLEISADRIIKILDILAAFLTHRCVLPLISGHDGSAVRPIRERHHGRAHLWK